MTTEVHERNNNIAKFLDNEKFHNEPIIYKITEDYYHKEYIEIVFRNLKPFQDLNLEYKNGLKGNLVIYPIKHNELIYEVEYNCPCHFMLGNIQDVRYKHTYEDKIPSWGTYGHMKHLAKTCTQQTTAEKYIRNMLEDCYKFISDGLKWSQSKEVLNDVQVWKDYLEQCRVINEKISVLEEEKAKHENEFNRYNLKYETGMKKLIEINKEFK